MHVATIAIAAAGLGLWHLGRLDHGPLGSALRGEPGTVLLALAGLACLASTLQFVADAFVRRWRHRQSRSAPMWPRAVAWIGPPLLSVGYGLAFAAQFGDSNTAVASPLRTTTPVAQYPAAVRQHFMNSCITSGGTQSSCSCSIEGIEAHYTLKEFVAFDAQAKAGEHMPPELVRIVSTCNAKKTTP